MTASLTTYRNIQIVSPTPTGNAGLALNSNFIALADQTAALTTSIASVIPSQTSNSGKFLTTNGTNVSWATVTTANIADYLPLTGGTLTGDLNLNGHELIFGGGSFLQHDDTGGFWVTNVSNQQTFAVEGSGIVTTANNTLDNGSGNVIISGTLTLPTTTTSPVGVTTVGFTDSGSTAIHLASTYKGSSGTTAYTIGDLVTILKASGILKP